MRVHFLICCNILGSRCGLQTLLDMNHINGVIITTHVWWRTPAAWCCCSIRVAGSGVQDWSHSPEHGIDACKGRMQTTAHERRWLARQTLWSRLQGKCITHVRRAFKSYPFYVAFEGRSWEIPPSIFLFSCTCNSLPWRKSIRWRYVSSAIPGRG